MQDCLLGKLPTVTDLQCAWLLLLFCAAPRANYLLRMLPPGATEAFARQHDEAVRNCLATLLSQGPQPLLPESACRALHLLLRYGGLGLRSAVETAPAAYWASWADCLPAIRTRAACVADRLVGNLQASADAAAPILAARHAAACLRVQGFEPPALGSLQRPPAQQDERECGDFLQGWQRLATTDSDQRALETHLSDLIPHLERCCCRRGHLDPLGDHRAACVTSGVLASRALPLERAVVRVCQEAGARVARNVRLADMTIDVPVSDERRSEVVANGLALWHGSQQAVDATIVSPVTRAGEAQPGAAVQPGRAPELVRARRCRLVVVGVEVGGRFGNEAATWLRLFAQHKSSAVPAALRTAARPPAVKDHADVPAVPPGACRGVSCWGPNFVTQVEKVVRKKKHTTQVSGNCSGVDARNFPHRIDIARRCLFTSPGLITTSKCRKWCCSERRFCRKECLHVHKMPCMLLGYEGQHLVVVFEGHRANDIMRFSMT